jgi:hypothetical protein
MASKHKTFDISCGKCGQYVLTYHKFGAGKGILRLYLANIAAPKSLTTLAKNADNLNDIPHLKCPACEEMLGSAIVSKGKRWAYRMRQGYFHRKLKK